MIGTLCFIADINTENKLNEFKMEASELYHVGVKGGNIPRHISLGMPYEVPDWQAYIHYAEIFAKQLKPVSVEVTGMKSVSFPTPDTGAFVLSFKEDFGLDSIRMMLRNDIKEKLNIVIEDSLIGKRNIALGCGTKSIDAYTEYVKSVSKDRYLGLRLVFNKLGVFYYPTKNWDPSTYICYRQIRLNGIM